MIFAINAAQPRWARSIPVLPAAIVGASLAVWLFYEQTLGWTTGTFMIAIALLCAGRSSRGRRSFARSVLLLVTLTLGVALVEQPTLLATLCAIASLGLLAMTCRAGWTHRLDRWLGRWIDLLRGAPIWPFQDLLISGRWASRHPRLARGTLRRGLLWIIPLLLGGVFLALFSIANPIVEQWINRCFVRIEEFLSSIDLWLRPGCVVFWCSFAGAIYALLRFRRRRPRDTVYLSAPAGSALGEGLLASAVAAAVVVRCLVVFNAIFVIQSALDGVYLIGQRQLPAGMTYVQYAHRGAYPLIATALLAGLFVLITFREGSRTAARRDARLLVYLWIFQNVGLTLSAAWRLKLLIDHSDLTRLRLSTAIWLGLVSLGLLSLIVRIAGRRSSAWLVRVNLSMALLTLYVCSFANLDGFIANYNASRSDERGPNGRGVSLVYLRHLGPSALPAVHRLETTLLTPERREAARQLDEELRNDLRAKLSDWRGWTWRRQRLLTWSQQHPPGEDAIALGVNQRAVDRAAWIETKQPAGSPCGVSWDLRAAPPEPVLDVWCRIARRRRRRGCSK